MTTNLKPQSVDLLKALKKREMTTKQIRDEMGIGNPAPRVFELREAHHDIRTKLVKVKTRRGQSHVAKYGYYGRMPRSAKKAA